jgi:hypothetical protein
VAVEILKCNGGTWMMYFMILNKGNMVTPVHHMLGKNHVKMLILPDFYVIVLDTYF